MNYKAYYEQSHRLIEAIAAWETENGTIAGILPFEAVPFTSRLRQAAIKPGASARAALSALTQED